MNDSSLRDSDSGQPLNGQDTSASMNNSNNNVANNNNSLPTASAADIHYSNGIHAIQSHEFENAVRCFSKSIFLSPGEPLPYVARAEAYAHLGDTKSSISNYRKALTLMKDPVAGEDLRTRLAQMLDTQGIVHFREGRVDLALRYSLEAIASRDTSTAQLHRCIYLIAQGKRLEAEKILAGILHDADVGADATVLQIQIDVSYHRDFAKAKALLEDILYKFSSHPRVLDIERFFDMTFDKYKKEAEVALDVEKLTTCIAAFPEDGELYKIRAIAHASRKSFTLAVQDLFSCINKSGGSNKEAAVLMSSVLRTVADELVEVGDYSAATNYYTESLKWADDELELYIGRADCYSKLGKHEEALTDLKKVVAIEPDHPVASERLALLHDTWGSVLYNQGKYDLAEAEFTRAIVYFDQNPLFFYHRALCRIMLGGGKQPSAVRDLLSCRDLDVEDADIRRVIAQFCGKETTMSSVMMEEEDAHGDNQQHIVNNKKVPKKLLTTARHHQRDNEELSSIRQSQQDLIHGKYTPSAIRGFVKQTRLSSEQSVVVRNDVRGGSHVVPVHGKTSKTYLQQSSSSSPPNTAEQQQQQQQQQRSKSVARMVSHSVASTSDSNKHQISSSSVTTAPTTAPTAPTQRKPTANWQTSHNTKYQATSRLDRVKVSMPPPLSAQQQRQQQQNLLPSIHESNNSHIATTTIPEEEEEACNSSLVQISAMKPTQRVVRPKVLPESIVKKRKKAAAVS